MSTSRWLLGILAISALIPCAAQAGCGAAVPWVTYEAEQGATNGTILGPDFTGQTPAREASGRQCLRLAATGQFLQFTAKAQGQGLVVRYCLPDSPDGRGIEATLSLYINGKFRAKLPMTSRYCYLYGRYPFNKQPASGSPRHFWDEVRILPGTIHAGDVIRLQKNADDAAPQYLIDFVDLEQVPSPLVQPKGSLSVTEFGATANGQSDSRPAFLAAIAAARQQHKSVWIPPGRYLIAGPIELSDNATVLGAGMWYSTLIGAGDYSPAKRLTIHGNGSNITLADFAVVGNLRYRNDSEPNDGIVGSFGRGSTIRNIWVEHTKTGAWITNSDGLLIEGCRFRDTIADGLNLCVGMRDTTVRDCTARGTGDDCFAIWPANYARAVYQPGDNRLIHCTAQLPSLAQGFAIYGGKGNAVDNCLAIDIPYGAGLLASTMFPTESGFGGVTTYQHVTMIRAGDRDGAIGVMTNLLDLAGLRFSDIDVIDSPADGIKFRSVAGGAIGDAAFDHIRIVNPAGYGIHVTRQTVGSANMGSIIVQHPKSGYCRNDSSTFQLIGPLGTEGVQLSGADVSARR